jgi:ribosomal protein S27AE
MERMLCESCAAVSYSAAAKKLVERGATCPRCGGALVLDDRERPDARRVTERSES